MIALVLAIALGVTLALLAVGVGYHWKHRQTRKLPRTVSVSSVTTGMGMVDSLTLHIEWHDGTKWELSGVAVKGDTLRRRFITEVLQHHSDDVGWRIPPGTPPGTPVASA